MATKSKKTPAASTKTNKNPKTIEELKRAVEEAELRAQLFNHRADLAESQLRMVKAKEALKKIK